MKIERLLALLLLVLWSCQQQASDPADMIFYNGVIWTADDQNPQATTLAIRGDSILAVGGEEILKAFKGQETDLVDLEDNFITPGFIDTHVHFLSGGYGLSSVKLRDAATPEEFANRIAAHAEIVPKGTWIREGDWDHQLWGGELPRAEWIDPYTRQHPVFVTRLDGHISLANSLAMELAGIDKNTPDVDGGEIVRDSEGNPTGIFRDNAQWLVTEAIPDPTPEQNDKAILDGMKYMASNGVTTVHNMDLAGPEIIEKYKRIRDQQITRFYMAVGLSNWRDLDELVQKNGNGDEWLRIGVLKGMVDGALGSHTAAFFEPFTDAPADRGFFVIEEDSLFKWVVEADAAGLHLAIHAIGDRAIGTLLDAFEVAIEQNGQRDRRFRVEHAQHPTAEDIGRFGEMDIIASMQPYHAIDDGRWAEEVIGPERIKTTYAFRSFLDANVKLAFGSDWAVAPATPLEGIYAAVTRRTIDGANPDGWVPGQKITVEEALKAYTITGAYSSFEENIKGSLKAGKLADFVIMDKNLLQIDPVEIQNVKILETYVGGRKVYQSE